MSHLPTLAIIGPGKVGTALGVLAARAGYRVAAVGGRHIESTAVAARRIGNDVRACEAAEAAGSAELVLLTVTDDVVEQVCIELAGRRAFREGAIVAHCSGSLGSDVLASARDLCRCSVASMHPLQTFPAVEAVIADLPGTYCFCEGDKDAVPVVEELAGRIGLRPVRIPAGAKTLYHAASVLACNYLVALLDAAIAAAEQAGIDRSTAWATFQPLVAATVKNVGERGPVQALTGPIVRGDVETVRRHLQELDRVDGELANIYRVLGRRALDLAIRKGALTGPKVEEILAALGKPGGRIEDRIKRMIVERCFLDIGPDSIADDEALIERRDIDSLKLFEIVVGTEEEFGISVMGEEFAVDNFRTVKDIADCVRRNLT